MLSLRRNNSAAIRNASDHVSTPAKSYLYQIRRSLNHLLCWTVMWVRENEPFRNIGINFNWGQTGRAGLSKVRTESNVPEKLDRLVSVSGKVTIIFWERSFQTTNISIQQHEVFCIMSVLINVPSSYYCMISAVILSIQKKNKGG